MNYNVIWLTLSLALAGFLILCLVSLLVMLVFVTRFVIIVTSGPKPPRVATSDSAHTISAGDPSDSPQGGKSSSLGEVISDTAFLQNATLMTYTPAFSRFIDLGIGCVNRRFGRRPRAAVLPFSKSRTTARRTHGTRT